MRSQIAPFYRWVMRIDSTAATIAPASKRAVRTARPQNASWPMCYISRKATRQVSPRAGDVGQVANVWRSQECAARDVSERTAR